MHATYWQDSKPLTVPWLRASNQYAGSDEATLKGGQAQAQNAWADIRSAISAGESPIRWDEHVVACLDASFSAKVDWPAYHKLYQTHVTTHITRQPFSLVHGDAHAHFMWVEQRTPAARQCLIDFEIVGVGSWAQELGQNMISNMTQELCRTKAIEWVRGYQWAATIRGD